MAVEAEIMFTVRCAGCGVWFEQDVMPAPGEEVWCEHCEARQWQALERLAEEVRESHAG